MASLWASLWKLVRQQPVYCQGVIQAIIALAVSFGLSLSIEQVGSLTAVTAAVLAFVTQTQVTPIVNSSRQCWKSAGPGRDDDDANKRHAGGSLNVVGSSSFASQDWRSAFGLLL